MSFMHIKGTQFGVKSVEMVMINFVVPRGSLLAHLEAGPAEWGLHGSDMVILNGLSPVEFWDRAYSDLLLPDTPVALWVSCSL